MSRPRPATSSRRSERGSATIELLILLPALFAVMFIGVQAALYHHARQVAIAAAQEGARTAAGQHGTETEEQVHQVYDHALANGGSDEGPPGPRGDGGMFYGAYFRDPSGNKLVVYRFNPGPQ